MTTCPTCHRPMLGPLPAEPQWTFIVPMEMRSMNRTPMNRGNEKWSYRKLLLAWTTAIKRMSTHVPRVTGKRRMRLTRIMGKGKRPFDLDNAVGGSKVIVDAAVKAELLLDDGAKFAEVQYEQEKGDWDGVRFEVWEVQS